LEKDGRRKGLPNNEMQQTKATSRRRGAARIVLALSAVAVLAVAGLFHLARSRTVQLWGTLVARVGTPNKVVALTFDDGPNPDRLDEVLGSLGSVRATFFVNGAHLAAAPEAGMRLVAAGHELANHTYSHARMVLRSQRFIRREIEQTDLLIRNAGYKGEILFRPPYSWKLAMLPWFLGRHDRTTITWDIEPDSYAEVRATPQLIAAHIKERVRPGSIILLHPWWRYENVRAAIPMIIDELSQMGYRFLPVGELLAKEAV